MISIQFRRSATAQCGWSDQGLSSRAIGVKRRPSFRTPYCSSRLRFHLNASRAARRGWAGTSPAMTVEGGGIPFQADTPAFEHRPTMWQLQPNRGLQGGMGRTRRNRPRWRPPIERFGRPTIKIFLSYTRREKEVAELQLVVDAYFTSLQNGRTSEA
jgi:hypothetical protein